MVASFALLQMNLCQDIVKSFEVAGYFPRQRPLKLRVALQKLAAANGELAEGELRQGAKRKRVEEVLFYFIASLLHPACSTMTQPAALRTGHEGSSQFEEVSY
jgi:hypothetical protein